MKIYNVKYRNIGNAKAKWEVLKDITADGFVDEEGAKRIRYFLTNTNVRYEIPTTNFIFCFAKERQMLIENNAAEHEKKKQNEG